MLRLFLPLYLLLIVFIAIAVVALNDLPEKLLADSISRYDTRISRGTFNLLEEHLASAPKPPEQVIQALQPHFGYRIGLADQQHSGLQPEQWRQVMSGRIVNAEVDEADSYFRRYLDTGQALTITFSDSVAEVVHREAQGTYHLIAQRLRDQPQQQWPELISRLQPEFGFPIRLEPLDQQQLSSTRTEQLTRGRIVSVGQDTSDWTIYGRIPDSEQVLVAGPIEPPVSRAGIISLLLLIPGTLLALPLLFWTIPLWRAVRELSRTAEAFGQGDLSARARIGKRSALRNLAMRFNTMAEQIAGLVRGHRELTNAVSHELRTPIARMRFGLEMLEDAGDAQDRKRFAASLGSDIDELDTLVDELLVYARYENSNAGVPPEDVPLRPWLQQLIDHAEGYAAGCQLQLLAPGFGDQEHYSLQPRAMARAIQNLLRNACRYADSQVRVELCRDETPEYSLCIHIDDDGPGIPPSHRERIFEVFARVEESRDRDSGGHGLGLAIARKIVEAHGGRIEASESPLSGARLSIQLP